MIKIRNGNKSIENTKERTSNNSMDINSKELNQLLLEVEKVRRRKVVDYKGSEKVEYIDIANNIDKLSVPNNHLIFGRRGSGKTTLILASLKSNDNVITAIDIQPMKKDSAVNIIIKILMQTLFELQQNFNEYFLEIQNAYRKQYEGISGFANWVFRKRDKKIKTEYEEGKKFSELLQKEISLLEQLKLSPDEITYVISNEGKKSDEILTKNEYTSKMQDSVEIGIKLQGQYKIIESKIDTSLSAMESYSCYNVAEMKNSTSSEIKSSYTRTYRKQELLQEQRENVTFLFNELQRIRKISVFVYLDDFYQIPMEVQPEIIQYLHDIYINCSNNSFCFKIATLPYRLRMNQAGDVDMSHKDDFSPIKLDYDLSELDRIKEYLLSILVNIDPKLNITKQDVEKLFNNAEVLIYSIIATGGVPRDFLLMFMELVRTAQRDNKTTIQKEHVYTVVKSLRDDKDNNIEYDSDISPDLIREAVEILNEEVVGKFNTNVILYPRALVEKHEVLLKNLTNLRYLHIIKDSTTSESRKKEEFVAYLIDMSFYAVNKRLKQGFDFRRFWETDGKSRLTQLRQSKIWSFPDELLEKYKLI